MDTNNNTSDRIDSLAARRNKGLYTYPAAIFGLAMFVNFTDKNRRDETIGIFYPHFSWTSLLFVVTAEEAIAIAKGLKRSREFFANQSRRSREKNPRENPKRIQQPSAIRFSGNPADLR